MPAKVKKGTKKPVKKLTKIKKVAPVKKIKKAPAKKKIVKTTKTLSKKVIATKKKPVAKVAVKKIAAKSKKAPGHTTQKAKTTMTKNVKNSVSVLNKTTKSKKSPTVSEIPESMQSASTGAVSQILGFNIAPYHPSSAESYMSVEMQVHFRQILETWKHQLMEEVDRTVHHMKDEAANFPDPSDRATQEEEFSLELRTRDRERQLIRKIESALKLLDEGEYGYCESCGVEIGLRRLEARPTATLCVDCKTLDEIREKQQGHLVAEN